MKYNISCYKKPDEMYIYKTASDMRLPMNVYYPSELSEKMPVALCIHGGGWKGAVTPENQPKDVWEGNWMKHQASYYAQCGFIALEISYRCVDEKNINVKDLAEDCADAIAFAKNNIEKADLDNYFIIGDSAGAHLGLCMADERFNTILPKAVIACNPVTDCVSKWDYIGPYDMRKDYSPLFNVRKSDVKFFILHGTEDTCVDINDSIKYVKKMKSAGNDCEFYEMKGAKHAFILFGYTAEYEQISEAMDRIDDYLDKIFKEKNYGYKK